MPKSTRSGRKRQVFQTFLKNNGKTIDDIKPIARSSGRAHHAMKSAMAVADILSKTVSENTEAASGIVGVENLKHIQDKVLANKLYVGMVSIICRRKLGDTVPPKKIKDAIEDAHEVIRRSHNSQEYWFELQDTAVWVLVNLGGVESCEAAQEIIKKINDGNKPSNAHESPSEARKETFKKDYIRIERILREKKKLYGGTPPTNGCRQGLRPVIKWFSG